ncbi:hypothetical protein ACFP3T_13455 [Lactiplantibacillus dongliensis]|uniref:D-alanyl-D-alanine carboxypeptidase n=1 Tax=Lactiplantibacillus dongliensis TaxID=2559919 RepID=A0ABW1RB02_9LACO|nr:hypothetical protein [Lactiplantibacillus dongliensis]
MKVKHALISTLAVLSAMTMSLIVTTTTGTAETKVASVIRMTRIKRTKYYPNGGRIYKRTQLTKKAPAFKYVKTRLYATKLAKLKKPNGKKATYYYVKNKKGTLKGWIWQGYLNKSKDYAQRRSDFRRIKAAVQYLPEPKQTKGMQTYNERVNADFAVKRFRMKTAYNRQPQNVLGIAPIGIPDIVINMYAFTPTGSKAILGAYDTFKGRFNSKTNAKLAKLRGRLLKAVSKYNAAENSRDDNIYVTSQALVDALYKAIQTLA